MTDRDAGPVERTLLAGTDATFGVLDLDDRAVLAASTGPLVLAPSLGDGPAGRLAVHWLVGGVAVSGLDPAYLAVACTLPPGTSDDALERIWRGVDAAARALGVAVVTGHTARYDGCAFPTVGAGTAMAAGDRADLVPSDGATPGDRVVVTTGPATGAILLSDGEAGAGRIADASAVRDARTAAASGPVTAMATGAVRGIDGALVRLARTGGVGVDIDRERVPALEWTREVCARADVDPWRAFSPGTLAATVAPGGADAVLDALADRGIPATEVGEVVAGSGLVVDGEVVDPPTVDSLWAALGSDGSY